MNETVNTQVETAEVKSEVTNMNCESGDIWDAVICIAVPIVTGYIVGAATGDKVKNFIAKGINRASGIFKKKDKKAAPETENDGSADK